VPINQPLVSGDQARHVALLIKDLRRRGVRTAEVRPEAEKAWGEVITARATYNIEASRNCTPGAYNNENTYTKDQPSVFATAFGGGPIEYAALLDQWRARSIEDDLQLQPNS
jgi:cyclohexanone monooxygenase